MRHFLRSASRFTLHASRFTLHASRFTPSSPRPPYPVPAHDLEQAGVIGEAERLSGPGDVPVVPLEGRNDDLPLRLGLELLESLEIR
jgi:hypothetical protein